MFKSNLPFIYGFVSCVDVISSTTGSGGVVCNVFNYMC